MRSETLLRIARATNDLDAVVAFYRDGLGLAELYRFEQHEGFDGVMLGRRGDSYHLEFTPAHGHDAGRAPSKDNLLVFYFPLRSEWEAAVTRMHQHGYSPVRSFNPGETRRYIRKLRWISSGSAELGLARRAS